MFFAYSPDSERNLRVIYQWLRLEQLSQWWHWMLVAIVVALVVGHVISWYRRDWWNLASPIRWSLLILRLAAFVGILLYFLQLDRRMEQRVVRHSRVAILADTSLSMTAPGTPSPSGVPSAQSRIEEVTQMLAETPLLEQLASKHQVSLYRFDNSTRPVLVASLDKSSDRSTPTGRSESSRNREISFGSAISVRWIITTAVVLAIVSLLVMAASLSAQLLQVNDWRPGPWLLLMGTCTWLLAMMIAALGIVPNTHIPLSSLFGRESSSGENIGLELPAQNFTDDDEGVSGSILPSDWATALIPSGVETRIGDALRSIIDREVGNPLAGIILLTDGRNNAGIDPKAIVAAAQNARIPLHIVGTGSDKRPANIQLVEVDAPRRLYPGDRFAISALVGSVEYEGRTITVQFLSGRQNDSLDQMQLETETTLEIPSDGSLAAARVDLPPKSVGSWSYAVRILPLAGEADERDNAMKIDVEVVERQNRVLVAAGGPLREYQFVRNLLYRDKDVQSHVYLQSGGPMTSQEAQLIVEEFPADQAALSTYDAILAFDLDWTKIPEKSVQAMERWVGDQAGGLFILAGPVETPKWLARSASGARSQTLRDLSPVVLDVRGSALLAAGRIEGETAWPLTITPDGRQTEFLWLTDEPASSLEMWQEFPGVHTYYAAYELKPGAKALAYFSDPTSSAGGQQPIYLASQFYGAGRVVFQGGGEMWRLRGMGDQYFDRYYTKLVRWVSQGRLLLDSDRGVLLVDREEAVQGEQVNVRAVLKNEMYEPLVQAEVVARMVDPQGSNVPLVLRPLADGSQPGVYLGQFPVLIPGTYRIQLQMGGLSSDQFLRAQVQSRIPKTEMQVVERNDPLLSQLAVETGGRYWIGCLAASNADDQGQMQLATGIAAQDQVAYAPGAPDREFQLRWLGWLMAWIASALSLEWLSRRVHRLA